MREEIGLAVKLLERVIAAIDASALTSRGDDPWLYFYEDFLAAYDPRLRKDRGVYYTPKEVIQCQCHLIAQLLEERFDKPLAFADDEVLTLDPAAGTGAYIRAALALGLDRVRNQLGGGLVGPRATIAARNLHSFEILVGPYAVAHLRVTQGIRDHGGQLPDDGVHVYLTDTLESPHAAPKETQVKLSYLHRPLSEEHRRAQQVKANVPILVCLGNPPYDRQQIGPEDEGKERKGGWVRFGEGAGEGAEPPILEDFIEPVRAAGEGIHLKNLYNDYVYFWRWALWKVFEATEGPGIVSFITASSYLRGRGFLGMRKLMREVFDELWILDLEGGQGARKTENVFAIRTPVAIAVGVRHKDAQQTPATVHYAKITGSREMKLSMLSQIEKFEDLKWRRCYSGWAKPFLPEGEGDYFAWPELTDLFPWQHSGVQFKRTWPIAEKSGLLEKRWRKLLAEKDNARKSQMFRETGARTLTTRPSSLSSEEGKLSAIASLKSDSAAPIARYAFRSLDRQWALLDPRLADRLRPDLVKVHSDRQLYLTSLLTDVLGTGPAAIAAAFVPDLHHFRGSYGGKDIIPLWKDANATKANVVHGLLELLSSTYGYQVSAEDLLAYTYAILTSPAYAERFSEELSEPGPRLPLTKEASVFERTMTLGRRMIFLHTYGERLVPEGKKSGIVPRGHARCTKAIPEAPEGYPEEFLYDEDREVLHIGKGEIAPVKRELWTFSVSGFEVVRSWLAYRMKEGAGKRSSPLDEIRPERWTAEMTEELLRLLWILEKTVDMFPALDQNLDQLIHGELFEAPELPTPTEEERKPPKIEKEPQEIQLEIGND